MKVKTLLIIVAAIVVVGANIFVWYYFQHQSPVAGLEGVVVGPAALRKPDYLFSFGSNNPNQEANLAGPLAVAVDGGGRAYVVDSKHHAIRVYNANGDYEFKFGKEGKGPGEFLYPVGILLADGRIYVSEVANPRIQVFDTDGKYLTTLVENNKDPKIGAINPVAMALGPDGNIYVTDIFRQRVVVLSKDGQLVKEFGHPGKREGEFAYPNGIAVAKSGDIYVADSNNARIQVFDKDGKFLREIKGGEGSGFTLPRGIAVDAQENIFVVDTLAHVMQILDKNGKLLFTVGTRGVGDGQFDFPNGLALTPTKIYVADRENNRIVVFKR